MESLTGPVLTKSGVLKRRYIPGYRPEDPVPVVLLFPPLLFL